MAKLPESVAAFLDGERLAVAVVSRDPKQPANSIYRRLVESGFHVYPVNPATGEVEGTQAYPDVLSLPEPVDGVVIVTHPDRSAQVVRDCAQAGIGRVWLHRSIGEGSVSQDAVQECVRLGIECIVGGCPMMFCEPVDFGHKCMRWWFQRTGKVPR